MNHHGYAVNLSYKEAESFYNVPITLIELYPRNPNQNQYKFAISLNSPQEDGTLSRYSSDVILTPEIKENFNKLKSFIILQSETLFHVPFHFGDLTITLYKVYTPKD